MSCTQTGPWPVPPCWAGYPSDPIVGFPTPVPKCPSLIYNPHTEHSQIPVCPALGKPCPPSSSPDDHFTDSPCSFAEAFGGDAAVLCSELAVLWDGRIFREVWGSSATTQRLVLLPVASSWTPCNWTLRPWTTWRCTATSPPS